MHLSQIDLFKFRNYERMEIKTHPSFNIFIGENGQGKTNILESIYLLLRGRSFRSSQIDVLPLRKDKIISNLSSVKGTFVSEKGRNELQWTWNSSKKALLHNKKRISSFSIAPFYPCVLFEPSHLLSIKGGPEKKRQLVDELLVSEDPFKNTIVLKGFQKALLSRNRILREHRKRHIDRRKTMDLLESLNPSYFKAASQLTELRLKILENLLPKVGEAFQEISQDRTLDITVDYVISSQKVRSWTKEDILKNMIQRAKDVLSFELESGLSLVGPHKHQIHILVHGKDSRFYSSQGQQRALILAFKMAQVENYCVIHKTTPILLLDDILSELDCGKRKQLVKFLLGMNTQVFLTSTSLDNEELKSLKSQKEGFLFQVEKGSVFLCQNP